ncbi:MAG: cohesin domain-containing protein [Candidatus Borkfalkiaceae bacterium]|nr:cohesin domain-containing protein [Christensenellaceae bacterium]
MHINIDKAKKSKIAKAVLAAVFALFLTVGVAGLNRTKTVSAAESENLILKMQYGASIKLAADGLRFKIKMNKSTADYINSGDEITLNAYVAPASEFEKITDGEYKNLAVKVGGALDKQKIYFDGENYCANVCITGLAAASKGEKLLYNVDFAAIAFIKNGETVVKYADFPKGRTESGEETGECDIKNVTRSQYYVANSSFLSAKESYESEILSVYGWFGGENFPIKITSESEYSALIEKIEKNGDLIASLNEKTVFVTESVRAAVEAAGAKTLEEAGLLNVKYEQSTSPALVLNSAAAKAGETVQITVSVKNNPGFAAAVLSVAYDSSILSVKSVTYGASFSGGIAPNLKANPLQLAFENIEQNESDGVFATITFEISAQAVSGSVSPVTLSYKKGNVCDIDENDVHFDIISGKITVK